MDLKRLQEGPVDFIIDAITGYSLKGTLQGTALEFIQCVNNVEAPILSLDVPSGVDSTTGKTSGKFIRAKWTMTLALPKCGLRPETAGEIYLADIAIPRKTFDRIGLKYISPFGKDYLIPLRTDI